MFDDDDNVQVGSLCTHGSDLPWEQSACTLANSLSGEHVRIRQETFVQLFLCKPHATSNEVSLYLCLKEERVWCGVVWCDVSVLCVFVRAAM